MFTRGSILLLFSMLAPAHSQSGPDAVLTVRGYFDALGHNDFQRALSFTAGAAQERTANMVGTLKQQAAAANANVELKVKRVDVSLPVADNGPVDVAFDIDVIGKKWIFKKVAKKIAGHAQFYVATDAPRIVAIEGRLY
jgi:hypothetical protein